MIVGQVTASQTSTEAHTNQMESVNYNLNDGVATIRIDDGKRNALSPQVLQEIYQALDRAESDRATVIITGRESVFSAGFDLNVMKRGGVNTLRMLRAGYGLTARVMAYPYPVIVACNGHVMAMGVFLMLSADYVLGSRGDFKISANEVAIGMTIPRAGMQPESADGATRLRQRAAWSCRWPLRWRRS